MTTAWELIQRLRHYPPHTPVTIRGTVKPQLFVSCRDDEDDGKTIIVISENDLSLAAATRVEIPEEPVYDSSIKRDTVQKLRDKLREFFSETEVFIKDETGSEFYISDFIPRRETVTLIIREKHEPEEGE
ncbi:MAG: hypothetical protein V7L14_08985 [Nostoc sp.]|uniref:hypothetical protein n=1 Tax=Nostoc sp. TaxID=1180 RepID=UPI002FF79FA7